MENQDLIINTLDKIPQVNSNAKRIVGLVKEGSINTGYQLSDNSIVKNSRLWIWQNRARSPVSTSPAGVFTPAGFLCLLHHYF